MGRGSSPLTRGKPRQSHQTATRPWAHPRSRGENSPGSLVASTANGSSPLTRGKPLHADNIPLLQGLIPAHAGKTTALHGLWQGVRAHPRSRGENLLRGLDGSGRMGSSPLTRGKPARVREQISRKRLIPAHAGKTSPRSRSRTPSRAHPRSRGENRFQASTREGVVGSSPLTRGKRPDPASALFRAGLIPAHAGKT